MNRTERRLSLPKPGEIFVWIESVERIAVRELTDLVLSGPDFDYAAHYKNPADHERSIAGRTLLRSVLGQMIGCAPRDVPILRPERGRKLQIQSVQSIEVSLSHSGSIVALAVAVGDSVGVDIEAHRLLKDPEAMATRILTTAELDAWHGRESTDGNDALLRAWVRKEAILKGIGIGIVDELAWLEVGTETRESILQIKLDERILRASRRDLETEPSGHWCVADLEVPFGYVGAVATTHCNPQIITNRFA